MSDPLLFWVLAVLAVATFIRAALGFGEALVAVPLLALVIPVEVAAPLAVLVSITVAAAILLRDWREVQVAGARGLVVSTVFGIPLGLLLLVRVDEQLVKGLLALVILLFSTFALAGRVKGRFQDDRLAWIFGFAAGVLGGAYGMNGPPLVVYATLRGWTPERFRATLQGYFLFASSMGMAGYFAAGLWGGEVTRYFLLSLPLVLLATFTGRWAANRLASGRFLRIVHATLVLIGIGLLGQALGLDIRFL